MSAATANGTTDVTRIQPHSLEAERALVGNVFCSGDRFADVAALVRPEHFFIGSYRHVFEAAQAIHEAGHIVDGVSLHTELARRGRWAQIGGADGIADLAAEAVLIPRHLAERAEIVIGHWRARQIIAIGQRVGAQAHMGADAAALIASATAELEALRPAPSGDDGIVYASEMAKPLPPIQWLSRDLTIAPGRATVFAGEGGTRKSWLSMAMMVCGAGNIRLLGRLGLKPDMSSVYFDYEQTERITLERFQLLAKGHGVDLAGLGKRLAYCWHPVPTWAPRTASDWRDAVDTLCRRTEGVDLAVVDSVRSSSRGIEENSVFASGPMDLATEVSQRTGVTIVFIDHAGKPQEPGTIRTRKHAQRGHTSKLDASQTLFILSAAKGEPTLVTCERSQVSPEEQWQRDFRFALAAADGGVQLQEVVTPERPKGASAEFEALKGRVIDLVKREHNLKSKNAICARLTGGNKTVKLQAIDELVDEGMLVQLGGEGNVFRVRSS
jgi:hypothetical protein